MNSDLLISILSLGGMIIFFIGLTLLVSGWRRVIDRKRLIPLSVMLTGCLLMIFSRFVV